MIAAARPEHTGPAPWQSDFVDRCALLLGDATGMPPSHARVVAWLVVCEPAEQSAEELQAALGLSAGAISMAATALVRMGVVERTLRGGTRRLHYRIDPDGWRRVLRMRIEVIRQLRSTAAQALPHARESRDRLDEMHAMYAWFEHAAAEYAAQRWPQLEA